MHLDTANMEARKICLLHDIELLPLICKDCTVPVCSECLTSSHNRHNVTGISDEVLRHRELLYNTLSNDKTPHHLESLQTIVNESLANLASDSEKAEDDINIEADRIIKEAELDKLAGMKRKPEAILQHLDLQMKQFGGYLDLIQSIEGGSCPDDLADMDIVVLGLDLTKVLAMNENNIHVSTGTFSFIAKGSLHISEDTMGSVAEKHTLMSDSDPCQVNEIQTADEDDEDDDASEDEMFYDCSGIPDVLTGTMMFNEKITSITPRSSQCWLVLSKEKLYEVMWTDGQHIVNTDQALISNVKQVFRAHDGNIYILLRSPETQDTSKKNEWVVKKILPDNRIIQFCKLGFSYNACIGLTAKNDIAVLMIHSSILYNVLYYSRILLVLDNDGIIKTKTESDGTSFTYYNTPQVIRCLTNGDAFVLFSNEIRVFSPNLYPKDSLTYTGKLGFQQNDKFRCSDMCFDPYGNILLCVQSDNAIHILNKDGKFLRLLITEKDGLVNPVSLSFDNIRRLWIGCEDGMVFIVDYNTLYHSK